jgi:hypothetical protein
MVSDEIFQIALPLEESVLKYVRSWGLEVLHLPTASGVNASFPAWV